MDVKVIEVCCQPVLAEALAADDAVELAAGFKVLADPVRLRLLSLVATSPEGEVCACDLVEPVGRSQPTVSHHLSILAEAGLLVREQRGKWAWFRVVPETLAALGRERGALTGVAATLMHPAIEFLILFGSAVLLAAGIATRVASGKDRATWILAAGSLLLFAALYSSVHFIHPTLE